MMHIVDRAVVVFVVGVGLLVALLTLASCENTRNQRTFDTDPGMDCAVPQGCDDYFLENENMKIPKDLDYFEITSLSMEAREKLSRIRPESLGQASRIQGVSASDVSILAIYLK